MKLSRWLYKLLKAGSLTAILLLATSALVMAQDDALEGKPELQIDTITDDIPSLAQLIRDEVSRSGGQLDTQRVQWVFALSTGHYATDPQGARAAREVALQLLASLAAPEDSVTVRAWEMDLWDHLPPEQQRVVLTDPSDIQPGSTPLARLWPTTPIQNTQGGHDTEKVIVNLTTELSSSRDAVLVLLTNDAPSVTSKDRIKLLGTNAPSYLQTLEEWRRVEGDKNGATRRVKYVVATSGRTATAYLEMVLVVPREFSGAAFSEGKTREELRNPPPPVEEAVEAPVETAPVVEEEPAAPTNNTGLIVILVIGALIVLGVVLSRSKPLKFTIQIEGGNPITLDKSNRGQEIGQLVGQKTGDLDKYFIPGLPPTFVAVLTYDAGGRKITVVDNDDEFALVTVGKVGGTAHKVDYLDLSSGPAEYELIFEGSGKHAGKEVPVRITVSRG